MKNIKKLRFNTLACALSFYMATLSTGHTAVSLDRTRIIFNESDKTVLVHIANDNKQLPYLAQAWLENDNMEKMTRGPIVLTPPVQRIEAGEKSLITLTSTPEIRKLPQDRESVFYFTLREIPPKSQKGNVLQIALQTKIKLFYRPVSIEIESDKEWQKDVKLVKENSGYRITNPTPYHITVIGFSGSESELKSSKFDSFMIKPKSDLFFKSPQHSTPYLSYINDYGGRPIISFNCSANECIAKQ